MNVKVEQVATEKAATVGRWWRTWWVWVDQPPSLQQTWGATNIDASRIPNDPNPPTVEAADAGKRRGTKLRRAWRLLNSLDRPLWWALLVVCPAGLQGPARWILQRPTRRLAAYAFVALFLIWFAAVA
jgi:hypothetical protein